MPSARDGARPGTDHQGTEPGCDAGSGGQGRAVAPEIGSRSGSHDPVAALNAIAASPAYAFWVLAAVAAVLGIEVVAAAKLLVASAVLGAVLVGGAFVWDRVRRSYRLNYDLDPASSRRWQAIQACLGHAGDSESISRIQRPKQGGSGRPEEYRRQACRFSRQQPPFVKSNVTPLSFVSDGYWLVFLPDRMLVFEGKSYRSIDYGTCQVSYTKENMIESGPVPKDATVIGRKWDPFAEGASKGRSSGTQTLPVVEFGVVSIRSPQRLNESLCFSSSKAGQAVANLSSVLSDLTSARGGQETPKVADSASAVWAS